MSSQAHEVFLSGSSAHLAPAATASKRKTFFKEATPVRWSRSRVVDVEHIKLELSFDIPNKIMNGVASLSFTPITDDVTSLTLDAVDMTFGKITLKTGTTKLTTSYDGLNLRIDFAKALAADKQVTLEIEYRIENPKAGIYFTLPNDEAPNRPLVIWTQGQDEDSRFWFPCFDYPNEKATSEIIVTVPAEYTTLSNGKCLSKKKSGTDRVWHWKHETPHVSYLITLVIGEFVMIEDSWDGIPVNYYCHPGDEGKAANSFKQTPDMVRYFSEKIGVRYPYANYEQIPVVDFIFGGMENTTATSQTSWTLHNDRAHLDFSSNPLVSHELAHQWFGDLITCRDWSHGWLNEGFTTYMECCWQQEEHGDEEFQYYLLSEFEGYLAEDNGSYRRPIVCNRYEEPIDLFDRHLYNKGALVQHMLRFILGERLFWKAINHYTVKHAGGCTITQDWQTAIEEVTGRNLDHFFSQWIYSGGHPEFKLSQAYDAKLKLATLTVKQTQTVDELTQIFKLPVDVRFVKLGKGSAKAKTFETRLELSEGEQAFNLPLDFEPDYVDFDLGNWLCKTVDLSGVSEASLIAQLHNGKDGVNRVYAARELGKRGSRLAIEALNKTLAIKSPWFVHAEAATALGAAGSESALDCLLKAIKNKHPKVRRAIVEALAKYRQHQRTADALLALLDKGDESYFVMAAACRSLGATRDKRALVALLHQLESSDCHNQYIPHGAIDGLCALEDTEALAKIREACLAPKPMRLRYFAMMRYGKLGACGDERARKNVREDLETWLASEEFWVNMGSIAGLGDLGEAAAAPALRRKHESASDGRVKTRAKTTAEKLSNKQRENAQVQELRDSLDGMKKANEALLKRVDKLEALKK